MTSPKWPASRSLGLLLRRGLRTMIILDLINILMYVAYRNFVPTTHNTVGDRYIFGFSVAIHVLLIIIAFCTIRVAYISSVGVDAALMCAGVAAVVDIYQLNYTLGTNYIASTIVILLTFVLTDALYIIILLYARFGYSWNAWTKYIRDSDIGRYDFFDTYIPPLPRGSSANEQLARDAEDDDAFNAIASFLSGQGPYRPEKRPDGNHFADKLWPRLANGAIPLVVSVEGPILYYYIILCVNTPMVQMSGWVFLAHISTVSAALSWSLIDERTASIRGIILAYRWLLSLSLTLLVFDSMQMLYVKNAEVGILIALRLVLLLCVLAYIVIIGLSDVRFIFPSRQLTLFFTIQYVVAGAVTFEGAFVALYFAYAYAIRLETVLWYNLVHLITVACGVYTLSVEGPEVLRGLYATGISAIFVAIYDLMIIGFMRRIPGAVPTDYAVQGILLLVDIIYILSWACAWPNCTNKDGDAYARVVRAERMTWQKLWEFFARTSEDVARVDADVKSTAAARWGAEKIYLIITIMIRTFMLVEFAVLFLVILVLAERSDVPWYAWFYMLHWIPVLAAALCVSLQFDLELSLTFYVVGTFINFAADVILMVFLGPIYTPAGDGRGGVMTLFSFFYVCDIGNIAGFVLATFRTHPAAYATLYFMRNMATRVHLEISQKIAT